MATAPVRLNNGTFPISSPMVFTGSQAHSLLGRGQPAGRLHESEVWYDRKWTVTYYGMWVCLLVQKRRMCLAHLVVDGRAMGSGTAGTKGAAKLLAAQATLDLLGV